MHSRFARTTAREPLVVLVAAALATTATTTTAATVQDKPEGFRQILPRGGLVSIDEPTYVAADDARLSPSTWVLGVVIDGQARAYSLNLLNAHEVVNDAVGETNFAAVW